MIFTTYLCVHNLYLPFFYLHSTLKTSSSPEHPNEIKKLNEQVFVFGIIRTLYLQPLP